MTAFGVSIESSKLRTVESSAMNGQLGDRLDFVLKKYEYLDCSILEYNNTSSKVRIIVI